MRKMSLLTCGMICIASVVSVAAAKAGSTKVDVSEYKAHCPSNDTDDEIKYCTLIIQLSRAARHDGIDDRDINIALLNRATAYSRKDQLDLAIQDVSRYIERAPNVFFGYAVRSQFLLKRGQQADAAADCAKAWQLNPTLSAKFCRP